MLNVASLTVRYGAHTVLDSVGFSVGAGQWLMVVGPNGAGKSTLLNAVTQGVAYTGTIRFQASDVHAMRPADRARRIGILAQNHTAECDFSVDEIVRLGRYAYETGLFRRRDTVDGERAVTDALRLVGMEPLRFRSVRTLSGGELQRVFLSQVFAQNPSLLLLDEPTNHLDLIYQKQVFELIDEWRRTDGRAVISVVHDLSLAKRFGTHALLLNGGRCAAQGTIDEALSAETLNAVYGMDVSGWMRELLTVWR